MKKMLAILFAFAFALGINASAFANPFCGQTFPGNGPLIPVFSVCTSNNGSQLLPTPGDFGQFVKSTNPAGEGIWTFPSILIGGGLGDDFAITLGVTGKEDPYLQLSFVVTNLDNQPKSFSISVGIPIILPDGETEVFSTLIGSVYDLLTPHVCVTVSPAGNAIMTSFVTGPTATNQPLGVDLGTTITEPVAGGDYKFESGLVHGPTGSWNYLALSLDFDLSGPWDNIAGIAYVQIDPYSSGPASVPEPATLLLLGFGLAGFGIIARRKKKKLV